MIRDRRRPPAGARRTQRGVTTLEYIVLAAVLVLGLVLASSLFKGKVGQALGTEGDAVEKVGMGQIAAVRGRYDEGGSGRAGGSGSVGATEPERQIGGVTFGLSGSGPQFNYEVTDSNGDGVPDSAAANGSVASGQMTGSAAGGLVQVGADGKLLYVDAEGHAIVDGRNVDIGGNLDTGLARGHTQFNLGNILGYESDARLGYVTADGHVRNTPYGSSVGANAEAGALRVDGAWYLGDRAPGEALERRMPNRT